MSAILLDTNVVLRLAEPTSPEHAQVQQAIEHLEADGSLFLAPQVLYEFWVVATRPREVNGFGWSPAATHEALNRLQHLFVVLDDGPDVLRVWLEMVLRKDLRGKRAHDARLVALMLVHGVKRLLTLNVADFKDLDVAPVHPQEL